jgi:hypothetical protein
MGQYQGGPSNKDLSEVFSAFLGGASRFLMWLGGAMILVGAGFLFFTAFAGGQATGAAETQALGNLDILERVMQGGLIALAVGSTYAFWGEALLPACQLIFAALLFGAPFYVPMLTGNQSPAKVPSHALDAIHNGGTLFGVFAILVLIADLVMRVRDHAVQGVKADQMKYGKGIKFEEKAQSVFLGKCWQLPYCRKFVRERCPIFHSKRTCWKELVGCMCEEQVIRDAMENKPIPKDAILAAKMIPQNHRLSIPQKQERCKNCVIFNEHQRHKYRAWVPGVVVAFLLVYGLLHGPLIAMTNGLIESVTKTAQNLSMQKGGAAQANTTFAELLLAAIMTVLFSYSLKAVEFAVFKLKV